MSKKFSGRTAVVTGGAGGIGRATAEEFARGGANVAICEINFDAASEAAADIAKKHGVICKAYKCDVSDVMDVDAMVSDVVENLGSLDILVNNAGITRDNLIYKMSDDDWDLGHGGSPERHVRVHAGGAARYGSKNNTARS